MSYQKFFDGTYVGNDGDIQVTTLHNPAGFVMRSIRSGATLTITIDDALALFDGLDMHNNHKRIDLSCLREKG